MTAFFTGIARAVAAAAGKIIVAAVSEKVLTFLALGSLRAMAKKTTNTVDDELVEMIDSELKNRTKKS
jgi:hypothetical protein